MSDGQISSTILDGLKAVAPTIATALGGPLAGAATAWIASKLGVQESTVTAVTDAVQGLDPLKRIQLEQDFQKWYIEEQDKMILAYLNDVQSARQRDVDLAKAGIKNTRANWITGITFCGILLCVIIAVWLDRNLSDFAKSAVTTVLGVLIADWKQITSFEFGSTRDSGDKNKTIAKLSEKI